MPGRFRSRAIVHLVSREAADDHRAMAPPPLRRVAIVDDDLWIRNGRAQALAEVDGIEVVGTMDHAAAVDATDLWDRVDVALVDAWDHRAGFDRFPGVAVVEAIRRGRSAEATTIIVITGHVVNDMLRLRMAEAGADFFYGHEDVAGVAELVDVVLNPGVDHRPEVTADAFRELGVRAGSRPNAALAWLRGEGFDDAFTGESQKALSVSRRTIMRIRREVGAIARVEQTSTSGNDNEPRWPEWQHIVRFVNRVRGDEPPRPG
jgi:DNA-binding NarL/FixJ family response regulator